MSGFATYLETGMYSDLTVVVEGKEYKGAFAVVLLLLC